MSQLLKSVDEVPSSLKRGAVAVGNFDGVHLGHAQLIKRLVAMARRLRGPALVMTFDPPPAALLFPERPLAPPLTAISRRAALLYELGVDALIAYPTDTRLLQLSPLEFFRGMIVDALQAAGMVEGPNFRFGCGREGDVERLRELCSAAAIEFKVVPPSEDAHGMISSTRIRQCLLAGQIELANAMLTRPYSLAGRVVPGANRGHRLGFATANLAEIACLIPGPGVYAGRTQLPNEATGAPEDFAVALNIGPNPTFAEAHTKVEAHLIGYAGAPLYERQLEISLLAKIRDVRKFDSIDQLQLQIADDVAACAKYL